MSDPAAKLALDNAILEWKRKHNIRDHDPILANLEILEIYFNHRYANASVAKQPPSYTEFRTPWSSMNASSENWVNMQGT